MRSADILRGGLPLLLLLCMPRAAAAQVWLSEKGDAVVTASYAQLFSRDHLGSEGERYDRGQISNIGINTGLEYALSDLFTLEGNLTWMAARHQGADRLHGPLDTGIYHAAVQDLRVALRFSIPQSPAGLTITPYVGGVIPTHNYESRGHSAPGRHIPALLMGVGVGRGLGPLLPNGYVQGVYSYGIVERIGGMRNNRSNLEVETGYSVTSSFSVSVAAALQRTHGGILSPLPRHYHGHELQELQPIHDRIVRTNFFLMSTGASVALNRRVALSGSFIWTVSGQNTHTVTGFVVGTSWFFTRGLTLGPS